MKVWSRATAAVAVLVTGLGLLAVRPQARQLPPYGGAPDYVKDLEARRERVMQAMGPDSMLVLWSAPPKVYSTDTDYEYRQESNLLYLTGIDQEDTTLVLVTTGAAHRAFLFARAGDPVRELWNGHVMTPAEMTAASGIAN